MISPIIHQTWKSKTGLSPRHEFWRNSFVTLNPDFQHILYDDADNRALVHDTVNRLETLAGPLVEQRKQIGDLVGKVPAAFNIIGRASGIYGDFFNFYLCDLSLKVNGLQPGGPVRSVKLFQQPSGRCTLK